MHGRRTTVLAVLALTLTPAVAHGVVTSRWTGGRDAAPEIPADRIPMKLGDWVGEDTDTDFNEPGLANLTRRYTNTKTGRWLLVSLTAGHPGLTAVHTP